jgi:LmbE family N-acetylglucosaminyl deacetylase
MGDCRVEDTFDNRIKVVEVLRRHRPQLIFSPYYNLPIGRGLGHNDHYKTGQIVSNAYNLAHLRKAPAAGEPHQAKGIYYYFLPPGTMASFVVDVSAYVEDWLSALDCHQSQFHHPDRPRPAHLPQVRDVFLTNAAYWGWQIGAKYGQAFLATSPMRVGDPMSLVKDIIPRP